MFRKLLSNLPFNPSLINQVSFYAKRIHNEQGVRRSGMVMMVLALMLQLFAVVAPPEPSLAGSTNDIINGGFTSRDSAYEHCVRNTNNFGDVLRYFHIDCHNIKVAETRNIRSTDEQRRLMSIGRRPYGKQGERTITDAAGGPYYLRYLWAWDSAGPSTYRALTGTNTKGQKYMVLFDCANVVVIDKDFPVPVAPTPVAAPKKPKPEISKTTLDGTPKANTKVRPGDILGYRIHFKNAGDGAATGLFVEDSDPAGTTFIAGSQGTGGADRYSHSNTVYPGHGQEPHAYWVYNNFPAGASGYYVDFRVRVNSNVTNGQEICNTAFIRSNETAQTGSNKVCHTVQVDAPKPENTPTTTAPVQTVTPPTKPCDKSQSATDTTSCLELHKSAVNNTKNGIDANNTTAAAGDVITYTITTRNFGTIAAKDYIITDNMMDTMEYAETITDLSGGTLGSDNIIRWPAVTIQPNEVVTKKITFKIKTTLPNTPSPPSNPGSFDRMMTNVYGDTVNIKLPGSVVTIVARTNTTLPNTGPGTTVTIAVLITIMAAYFFSRSRLMAKELDIVREEYTSSGAY